ncbi:MAG TPA: NAD(P)/FAD-dependent oxidoreductase, partial [Lichenihabitans sp.]|nr:NAD(P)/FAD-dependent oxidoreductase [Lichenihabitans sp.]
MSSDRPYDAIIMGGSFAGLSAALYLVRARRTVLVLDTAAPRNRFAASSHGFFGHDGADPRTMLATMREQIAAYPSVTFRSQAAADAKRADSGFAVTLANGDVVTGARLLLAHGVTDILPALPGLAERWGHSVLHCPYCHGYEVSGHQLGVLNLSPMSIHQAALIAEWGPTTFFLDGGEIEQAAAADLTRRGIVIEPSKVDRLAGEGSGLSAVWLADGRERPLDALFIGPPFRLSSDLAERLGCALEDGMLGPSIVVDEMKATSVAGVYAAGDITRMAATVTFACADGVTAALAIHRSLV